MDAMDPDFWRRQLQAFISAPIPCGVFLVIGSVAAWWFRGSVDQGETRGLRAQIDGLRKQINALEQRLKLASEQEQAATKAANSASEDIVALKEEMRVATVPIAEMTSRFATIDGRLREWLNAQAKVRETLQPSGGKVDSAFKVGNRVFHSKFGQGSITKVDGRRLSIHFDVVGDKVIRDEYVMKASYNEGDQETAIPSVSKGTR